jgi:hypothetical protein
MIGLVLGAASPTMLLSAHKADAAPLLAVPYQAPGYHQVPDNLAGHSKVVAGLPDGGVGSGFCAAITGDGIAGKNLGAEFDNIYACKPAEGYAWNTVDTIEGDFQCTELAGRFLYAKYGMNVTSFGDGRNFVAKAHSEFPSIPIGTPGVHSYPMPGDVVSMYGGSKADPDGHVAVVTSVTGLNFKTGTGYISVMEENGSTNGADKITVNAWAETYGSPSNAYYYYTALSWFESGGADYTLFGCPVVSITTGDFTYGSQAASIELLVYGIISASKPATDCMGAQVVVQTGVDYMEAADAQLSAYTTTVGTSGPWTLWDTDSEDVAPPARTEFSYAQMFLNTGSGTSYPCLLANDFDLSITDANGVVWDVNNGRLPNIAGDVCTTA